MNPEYQVELEKALSLLNENEEGEIHTFRQAGPMLIGAVWPKAKLIECMKKFDVYESGERAQKMNHGLVTEDEQGLLFIETKLKMRK